MDSKKIVKKGYNTITHEYIKIRTKDPKDVQLLQELVQRLPHDAKVLDVGCGAGVPVTKFLTQFFDVTGVDFAENQLQLARQLVPRAQFVCQDMTDMTFPDHSFDAICSYYAIIHIPRQKHHELLTDFYRIVTPSGLVLLCMGADDLEEDTTEDYLGAPMYWSHYDAETNMRLIKECGFDIIWSRIVVDSTDPDAEHLFVLAQKR
jgi:ubiquinone/menaquinone biosynthesis C-methylase UbiE